MVVAPLNGGKNRHLEFGTNQTGPVRRQEYVNSCFVQCFAVLSRKSCDEYGYEV